MLTFQEYREHLFTRCGFMRNSSGKKIHKAYKEYCYFQRKYPRNSGKASS